jgi:hypothetical protein
MKKILLLFIAVITMTSCQLTEEVTFNEDGSGTYNLAIDMSAMMSMKEKNKKTGENEEIRKPEKTDSIMYVKDLLEKYKDSLKNLSASEKAFMERMKNATMRMQIDEEAEKMIMTLSSPFKSVEDLKNISEDFRKIDKLKNVEDGKKEENPMGKMFGGMDNTKVSYTFSKHKFSRKMTIIENEEEEKADEEAEKTDDKIDKGMADMMKMFGYKIIYHFPRKIKNVSYKDAMLGTDGKTLIIQTTLDKIDKNPKLLEFDVTFE